MADNQGTLVTSPVRPFSDQDRFPSAYANELLGGNKITSTLLQRDLIPLERRIEGETCYVIENNTTYRLLGGISNNDWTEVISSNNSVFEYVSPNINGIINI